MNAENKNQTDKYRFVGEWVRLGELIRKAPIVKCGNRSYPVLSMTMHNGIVKQSGRFKKAIASSDASSYKVVNPGQLVVGFPIDEGVLYVQGFDEPGIMSPAYSVWDVDTETVDPGYLELALHSPRSMSFYSSKMRGTTARRRSMPPDVLCSLEVPLPSAARQKEVVEMLATIGDEVKRAEAEIDRLNDLVKSRFVEMFGEVELNPNCYEKACLKEIAREKLSYGASCSAVEYDGSTRFIRITDIMDSGSLNSDVKSPSEMKEKYLLFDGDILFARSGATVGKTYRYRKEHGRAIYAGYLIRLIPDASKVLPDYVFWYTKTDFYASFISSVQRVVAQPNINAQEYGSLEILVPPIEEQEQFVSFVQQVDKLRFAIQVQIEKLETLKASLMQEYFG